MGLGSWLFGTGKQYRGVLLGLDCSGKTTLLYRLKLGTAVKTIPTMGFNVETIAHHSGSKFEIWEVGGCDKMRPLVKHYITRESFIVYIFDLSDKERMDEALTDFTSALEMIKQAGSQHVWVVLNKQDILQSSNNGCDQAKVTAAMQNAAIPYREHICLTVLNLPRFSAEQGTQTSAMLDEIQTTLSTSLNAHAASSAPTGSSNNKQQLSQGLSNKELLNRIQKADALSLGADAFWDAFLTGQLEEWDHYAHLRAGYLVILKQNPSAKGVFHSSDAFIVHLERLRATNPQRFKNTTHRTMTVFWVLQLFRAASKYQIDRGLRGPPTPEQFSDVLSNEPTLMDSSIWKKYYTKDLMFSPEAKESWLPPDLRPFPPTVGSIDSNSTVNEIPRNDEHLLEFGFTVAQSAARLGVRRGTVVKQALETLEVSTIRHRAMSQTVPPYSETQAYFWIQLATAALGSLAENGRGSQEEASCSVSAMTFAEFRERSGLSGSAWKDYYSAPLWESLKARTVFTNPDLKPLPNVLGRVSK